LSAQSPPVADPAALIRSSAYRRLLVLAALIGLLVSTASWAFLELVHELEVWVYKDLPDHFGYTTAPTWWSLPWVALAGALTGIAVTRLPGRGGHVPAQGLKAGGRPTQPVELPGVLLAALATLGLGLVLGPEGPLLALGMGLAILAARIAARDAPDEALALMAAAGGFAALSAIFGSPVIGAVIIIEASGLGGAMLPLVLLPGLLAAGIGSLVFVGLGSWSGFSTSAWALSAFPLPPFGGPGWGDFAWTIVLALATAVVVFAIMEFARWSARVVAQRTVPLTIAAGLAVGGLAIAFAEVTGKPVDAVLFSGEPAFGTLFKDAPTISLSALAFLILFKGLAYSISLGGFRGGPTFPAIFLGAAGGILCSHLPGFPITPAVAVGIGAATVAILRLPLSAVVIASLLTSKSGAGAEPLVILGVVVSYLVTVGLSALRAPAAGAAATKPAEGPPAPSPVKAI